MGNMIIDICYVKFNYDRLRLDKALGNYRKFDNERNNVRSAWRTFLV